MDGYISIRDSHLAHYFSRPDVFAHLLKMGLVTNQGKIVTDTEWRQKQTTNARKARFQQTVELLDEGGLMTKYQKHKSLLTGPGRLRGQPKRHSVAFILSDGELVKAGAESKRRKLPDYPLKLPVKENVCPLRWNGRIGIDGEPYLSALPPPSRSNTPYSCSSAPSRGSVFERLYPEPPDDVNPSSMKSRNARKYPPAIMTLQFLGSSRPTELMILQQPCGTYTVPIYSHVVTYGESLEIVSQRRQGCRFSVVLCEDGVAISRLSSCCEHRYTSGRRLGGPSGHLRVLEISEGEPCSKCVERVETSKLKCRYLSSKKAVGNKRRPPSRHPLLLKKTNHEQEEETDSGDVTESEYSDLSDEEDKTRTSTSSDSRTITSDSYSSGKKTTYHPRGLKDENDGYQGFNSSQDLGSDDSQYIKSSSSKSSKTKSEVRRKKDSQNSSNDSQNSYQNESSDFENSNSRDSNQESDDDGENEVNNNSSYTESSSDLTDKSVIAEEEECTEKENNH